MGEFGKDDKVLDNIPSHRGTFRQAAKFSQATGSNNKTPRRKEYWTEQFKLPLGAGNAATIKVVPGAYITIESDDDGNLSKVQTIWKKAFEHNAKGGSAICSGGPYRYMESHSDMRSPCHGCDESWAERWDRRNKGENEWENMSMRTSALYGITVAILGIVHKVQAVYGPGSKRAGQLKVSTQGDKVMEWATCTGRGCEGCRTGAETQDGIQLPWVMKKYHFQTFAGWADSIGEDCTACQGERTIVREQWLCPHCSAVVIDEGTSSLSREELDDLVDGVTACPECKNVGFLQEAITCKSCDTPVRANLWDVEIDVYGERPPNSNLINLQKARVSRPKPIARKYAPLVMEPLDLDSLLKPSSLEHQAKRWNITSKVAEQNVEKMAREYKKDRHDKDDIPY